ncbi:MAG: type II secretion system protein GspJ [Lysobacterales bacterium CG02_land_8_20_14_3_00_62_12]|nr:MAG: type II secretion system protein GspJ [Xanthomonadales bacterium CG02_land_8_20_14_3_00_62_12]
MTRSPAHRQRASGRGFARIGGFTLIEILVAVLIFALMSAAAYGGVEALLRSRLALAERARALAQLQTCIGRLQRDLRQALPRPTLNGFGEPVPALLGQRATIELTRAGLANPLGAARSRSEHLRWQLKDQQLLRQQYSVLDRAANSAPVSLPMLDQVSRLEFRYLDGNDWRAQWPRPNTTTTSINQLPRAVEITITSARFGSIRRLVDLVDNATAAPVGSGAPIGLPALGGSP